jgi:putative SbcD/Mre11-related phosphoesterase
MRFVYNEAAVLHRGALIIGDTHFGIEERLRRKGISAYDISKRLATRITTLVKLTRAKRLIILGDVKENIAYVDDFTRLAFAELEKTVPRSKITIVRGNHDGRVEELGCEVVPAEGFVYGKLGLMHGHSWPGEKCMNADYLLSAHQHPQMEMRDASGKKHAEPVWAVADADVKRMAEYYDEFNKKIRLVLMPAFNPLVGSAVKNAADSHLGPVLNNKLFKWNDAILYHLNGVAIGKLSRILKVT